MSELKYPFLELGTVNAPYKEALKAAAARVIDSGRYVGGAENEAFESELCSTHRHALCGGCKQRPRCFKAHLQGIYRAGTPPRRRCRDSSANTYIASVLAVTDAGLRPIFAEPCSATLNLDTSRPRRGIYPDVKAVLTVHLYGRACYDTVLDDFAHRHELIVVEDNAQAIGAEACGFGRTGSLGHAAAFSFYPTKKCGSCGRCRRRDYLRQGACRHCASARQLRQRPPLPQHLPRIQLPPRPYSGIISTHKTRTHRCRDSTPPQHSGSI